MTQSDRGENQRQNPKRRNIVAPSSTSVSATHDVVEQRATTTTLGISAAAAAERSRIFRVAARPDEQASSPQA
jgi:hypothetical protein